MNTCRSIRRIVFEFCIQPIWLGTIENVVNNNILLLVHLVIFKNNANMTKMRKWENKKESLNARKKIIHVNILLHHYSIVSTSIDNYIWTFSMNKSTKSCKEYSDWIMQHFHALFCIQWIFVYMHTLCWLYLGKLWQQCKSILLLIFFFHVLWANSENNIWMCFHCIFHFRL